MQVTGEYGTSAPSSKDHFRYENPTVTAVSPVRENRTPTLHVSDEDAVPLTIVTPFTENPRTAHR